MTAASIRSTEGRRSQASDVETGRALRIRLGETGEATSLSTYLTRMGFSTTLVDDDTIEVAPISPINRDYDNCTMQAYVRAWHELHIDAEIKLIT